MPWPFQIAVAIPPLINSVSTQCDSVRDWKVGGIDSCLEYCWFHRWKEQGWVAPEQTGRWWYIYNSSCYVMTSCPTLQFLLSVMVDGIVALCFCSHWVLFLCSEEWALEPTSWVGVVADQAERSYRISQVFSYATIHMNLSMWVWVEKASQADWDVKWDVKLGNFIVFFLKQFNNETSSHI